MSPINGRQAGGHQRALLCFAAASALDNDSGLNSGADGVDARSDNADAAAVASLYSVADNFVGGLAWIPCPFRRRPASARASVSDQTTCNPSVRLSDGGPAGLLHAPDGRSNRCPPARAVSPSRGAVNPFRSVGGRVGSGPESTAAAISPSCVPAGRLRRHGSSSVRSFVRISRLRCFRH